jgi:RimJ/RimL family protein N-acetyltransferase
LIGVAGLRQVEMQVELLFSLCPGCRGRGLATEAARAVLDDALCSVGVVAFTDAGNLAAQRVLARLGMTPSDFAAPWVRWRRS